MKTRPKIIVFTFIFCLIIGCTSGNKKKQDIKETSFFSLNINDVKSEIEFPLSELVESLEVIPLENKDEAFSKIGVIYVSDNYLGMQPYGQFSYKLFDKNGKFICDVGARGQGPGEYRNVYFSQINEKKERIYIVSHNAKKILTYDLKGIFLENECIPLAAKLPKGSFYVNNERKEVTVISLPFRGEQEMVCWTQDFSGKLLQYVSAAQYAVIPDYSNEVYSFRNTSSYDFQLGVFYQEKPDTLYHYNVKNNSVNPVFTLNAPIKAGTLGYRYMELPDDYLVARLNLRMGANPDNDVESTKLILTNKKTKKSQYVRIINDYLGGWEFDPFFLSFRIRDGYFTYAMEPIELKELLEESLKKDDLQPDVRKRITELNAKLDINDNNVILAGKLKKIKT